MAVCCKHITLLSTFHYPESMFSFDVSSCLGHSVLVKDNGPQWITLTLNKAKAKATMKASQIHASQRKLAHFTVGVIVSNAIIFEHNPSALPATKGKS